MSFAIELMESVALNLLFAERARLVEKLLATLESEPSIETAWDEEVNNRLAAIENGTASWLSSDTILAELKAKFQ